MTVRKWTDEDEAQANELGFMFMGGMYLWPVSTASFSRYGAGALVDLYVWTLAAESEPTACKALEIMDARGSLRESCKIYLAFTDKSLAHERFRYELPNRENF